MSVAVPVSARIMGKRSSFERIPRDFYPTPWEAVISLAKILPSGTTFVEPCAGDGTLIRHLEAFGHRCLRAFDIEPQRAEIELADARDLMFYRAECFITNPPWSRHLLHPIIENLSRQLPTWLLFDADWMHTRQSAPFIPHLRKIVSVGRVKWIPDSPFTGKDNCCWYLFDQTSEAPAQFIGRAA
jgi:hypothetical protein